jgi:hypothetical protein
MSLSLAGIASAHHQDGHDANTHGMCTAYFSGSENGQGNKRGNANSFSNWLQETDGDGNLIHDWDGDGDVDAYDIASYCNETTGGFGNPGGGNTPFFGDSNCGWEEGDEGFADEDDNDQDDRCDDLEAQEGGTDPGNSNGNNGGNG